jgi:hypothetical protein
MQFLYEFDIVHLFPSWSCKVALLMGPYLKTRFLFHDLPLITYSKQDWSVHLVSLSLYNAIISFLTSVPFAANKLVNALYIDMY